ncbi:hypothetical protein AC579_8358 [Pseudocercospora musae]|uniref:ASX DEUBAD domain-containing protein n=1 Tax=Pseudocercospora musae TaxID=113226 RepID=A0A139II73_9PEZI|nr:hypothetical protein AC579_8358 [Pseudocercospora musae]KXT14420.1 hypothetical protein AC579_8358 [Pseudocercospora musae]
MAQQKRWLTQPNSKLGKVDLSTILRKEGAWEVLTPETRQDLYAMLPAPREGEPAHDIDVHPLKTRYKQYIEGELRRWQQDLIDGKESKKWREAAMRAGQERAEGKWDVWKEQQRENDWGQRDENGTPKEESVEDDVESDGK